jgi:hypothetical protein
MMMMMVDIWSRTVGGRNNNLLWKDKAFTVGLIIVCGLGKWEQQQVCSPARLLVLAMELGFTDIQLGENEPNKWQFTVGASASKFLRVA